jgi:hypothetical protein
MSATHGRQGVWQEQPYSTTVTSAYGLFLKHRKNAHLHNQGNMESGCLQHSCGELCQFVNWRSPKTTQILQTCAPDVWVLKDVSSLTDDQSLLRDATQQWGFPPPFGCPCTSTLLCQSDTRGLFAGDCSKPDFPAPQGAFSVHGGAGRATPMHKYDCPQ